MSLEAKLARLNVAETLSTEELALADQWTTLSGRIEQHLDELNDSLRSKTYIVGVKPSKADSAVFDKVFPLASKWTSVDDVAKYRHILRWVDLVQNKVGLDNKLKIDLSMELPREIKEKKKKDTKEAKDTKETKPAEQPKTKGKAPLDPEALAAAKAAKEAKKAAKAKANAQANAAKPAAAGPTPAMVDIRVGFIEKAIKHPDADSLYVSTIQMGDEEGPRTICSGLVNYYTLEEMQQRYVVVIANLKPVSMRGIKSAGMVFCASEGETVEFVIPPEGSKPGDKLFFEGFDGVPEKQLNPKKKIFEQLQPNFSTSDNLDVVFKQEGKPDARLVNKAGLPCKSKTLVGAAVK
ncbi:hypothetical protein OGAPHI_001628 [Ogataea philodendri]|uniref:tRNA-binding domain-containing protein n=1 Tax=Ogataea philodendri TaxID=1378263 RepID=A0A9P8PDW6_9ASCO|nr:uncharacterized protein OGAPHI_001628 [Ogataea philodendri]KAH3669507.1 hypothetical protein OGAPHI_001628 [Ogataea philodendri]